MKLSGSGALRNILRTAVRYTLLTALLVVFSGGCKERIYTSLDLPDDDLRTGAGLKVEAVYLSDGGEIEDLFGSFLPAEGVLPVLVAVRNNDTATLRLHSRNNLPVGDSFASFVLDCGGKQVEPLHPLEVVMSVSAKEGGGSYKDVGKGDVAVGVFFPPLGAWYAWKEYKARTEYKPLIRASLLPARFGGAFDPLEIAPGEEYSGYLYFPVDSTVTLYDKSEIKIVENEKVKTRNEWRLKEDTEISLVLRTRPSLAETSEAVFTAGSYDSGQVRDVRFAWSPPRADGQKFAGIFRILDDGGEERLVWTPVNGQPDGDTVFETSEVDSYSGSGVTIADAGVDGDRGIVAVNFTRKTRVYLLDLSGRTVNVLSKREFERKTDSVYMTPGGAFAVTSDRVCREIPADGRRDGAYTKLGTGVNETGLDGAGNLNVFRGKTTTVFDLSPERRYEMIAEGAPVGSGVEVLASFPDHMILLLPGNDDSGDSIMVYDPSGPELVSGILLGGNVVCAGPCGDGVVVQMENGTVLVLSLETGDEGESSLRIDRAFFLESIRGMIAGAGNSLMMSGKDCQVIYGKFDPYLPLTYEIESRSILKPSLPIDKD